MSKYTTEVRYICETAAGYDKSQGYSSVNDIRANSWKKIFDFNFELFDSEYKSVICSKILKHYYTREIGFESVGLWKLKLETRIQEIMPYFNKLYEIEAIKFNPLHDVDYTKEHTGESAGTSTATNAHRGNVTDAVGKVGSVDNIETREGGATDTSEKTASEDANKTAGATGNELNVFSDTPQGTLTNVENNEYLTDARKITTSTNTNETDNKEVSENGRSEKTFNEEATATKTYREDEEKETIFNDDTTQNNGFNNTAEYIEHVYGKTGGGSYSKYIVEYRKSLINIDMLIIAELSDLFMRVW